MATDATNDNTPTPEAPLEFLPELTEAMLGDDDSAPEGRRWALPVFLFLATCLSTFWTGAVAWKPLVHLAALQQGFHVFFENLNQGSPSSALWEALAVAQMDWRRGLLYMGLVLGILLTHEMGHFVMTIRHRIPASLPFFIPLPIVPFGTLGAVIGMDGSRANRRELFDMGIAGPLAGLVVALPVTIFGILQLPTTPAPGESMCFHTPLIFQWLIAWLRPEFLTPNVLYLNQFNAYLMAGWMGMLVTGLNMLPVSQLDGGHVAYALLGQRGGHILGRGFLVLAVLFVIAAEDHPWFLMLVLIVLLGTDHPPTTDDRCRLGFVRRAIGWVALVIPILCFPPHGITPVRP